MQDRPQDLREHKQRRQKTDGQKHRAERIDVHSGIRRNLYVSHQIPGADANSLWQYDADNHQQAESYGGPEAGFRQQCRDVSKGLSSYGDHDPTL